MLRAAKARDQVFRAPIERRRRVCLTNKFMKTADFQLVPALRREVAAEVDPGASPFKIVIDPQMRLQLRRALIELIDNHDEALAAHYSDGKLALESYKEYIEVFARSLKETMESREGVSHLLRAVGFNVPPEEVNLRPELRWKPGGLA